MDDLSKFSRFMRISDPAVVAWRKVREAGEDDVAYEAAIIEFEEAKPVTFRGIVLKTKLEWQRMVSLFQGDQLTPAGRTMMKTFRKTIEDALASMGRQVRQAGFRW